MPPTSLDRWIRVPTDAGEPTRLALGASTLTIHERERPLASVDVLVTRCLAQLHAEGLRDAAPTDRVLVTTREGEYGALVTIAAPGEPAITHTLGVIYGDDFHTRIDARAHGPAHRAAVAQVARRIVLELPLGLGALRHRRFRHAQPVGWVPRAHGLVTRWSPVEDPAATITVFPARPRDEPAAVRRLDALLRDDPFDGVVVERALPARELQAEGLGGSLRGVVGAAPGGPRRAILTARLEDARFAYLLRLETSLARLAGDEAVFLALVRSCVRLPTPVTGAVAALAHWAS